MNIQKTRLFAAALGVACLASWNRVGSPASAATDGFSFATRCDVVDEISADGYVTNESQDTYQVSGEVRFVFTDRTNMSRPEIVSSANILIPPGQTVLVVRIKLAFQPKPGETCRFSIGDSLTKL